MNLIETIQREIVGRQNVKFARESTIINDGIKGTGKKELKT